MRACVRAQAVLRHLKQVIGVGSQAIVPHRFVVLSEANVEGHFSMTATMAAVDSSSSSSSEPFNVHLKEFGGVEFAKRPLRLVAGRTAWVGRLRGDGAGDGSFSPLLFRLDDRPWDAVRCMVCMFGDGIAMNESGSIRRAYACLRPFGKHHRYTTTCTHVPCARTHARTHARELTQPRAWLICLPIHGRS